MIAVCQRYTALLALLFLCLPAAAENRGERMHQAIIAETPLYQHPRLITLVNSVGNKLVQHSRTPDVSYQFFILDDPSTNAFTTYKGYVYINRGLLVNLNSVGELAAVLAHEIAHNTLNHRTRKGAKIFFNKLAEVVSAWFIGGAISSSLGIVNDLQTKKYSRELELEADTRGAEIMYKAGYDPKEMLNIFTLFKDEERLKDTESLKAGGNVTYHGVHETHPRSDKRLQQAILKAGQLPPGESYRGRAEMRAALDGVIIGNNNNGNKKPGLKRFSNRTLGITFLYPQEWQLTKKASKLVLMPPDTSLQLQIQVEKTQDKTATSKKLLQAKYLNGLSQIKRLGNSKSKDQGTTARLAQQRVAALRIARDSYYFLGLARNNQLTEEQDQQLLQIIGSFRHARVVDFESATVKVLHYQQLQPGETLAMLTRRPILGALTQQRIRIMNGYYPRGEPEPGMWVKLVKETSRSDYRAKQNRTRS